MQKRVVVCGLLCVGLWTLWAASSSAEEFKGNQVFFRGGGYFNLSGRSGEDFTDTNCLSGCNNGSTGYYLGAGMDFMMHKGALDFMGVKNVSLLGELSTFMARLNSSTVTPNSSFVDNKLTGSSLAHRQVEITTFSMTIGPKLKFLEGERFRPWILPAGLTYLVISPASTNSNYFDWGIQWGAGAEYNVYGPFNLGVEGRYTLTANMTHTQNSFGQAGVYLGIMF
jgi:opacity protein-like surface antigen